MAQKSKSNKFYTVIVIPEHKSTSSTYKIRTLFVRLLTYFVTALFLSFCFLVYYYSDTFQKAILSEKILNENKILKANHSKIEALQETLEKLKEYRKKAITSIQGFEPSENDNDSLVREFMGEGSNVSDLTSIAEIIYQTVPSLSPLPEPVVSRGFEQELTHQSNHFGVDIVAAAGAPIHVSSAGIVMFVGWTVKFGHTVIVQHPTGYQTIYKHNQRVTVVEGQKVKKGDIIAYLGNTGKMSSGVHLHFEIWKDGRPIDPSVLIADLNKKVKPL